MQIQKPKPGYKIVKPLFAKEIEIPKEWQIDEIQNHAKITTGSKNTQDKIEDGKYPFFVRSQKMERINSYSYDGEAVLTAGDGDIGKVFHYINGKFDFHQRVYKISDFSNQLDGYFFYLYFSKYFLERAISMSAKTSVDSIRMDMITQMLIPLPTFQEQKKIASILGTVDYLIESYDKVIDSTKKLKKGLMQQLLTKGIDHKKFKKITFGLRYMNREIPTNWKISRIGNVCRSIVSGRNKPEKFDGEMPWLTTEDFDEFYVEKSKNNLRVSEAELKEKRGKTIPPNSVLISCVGDLGLVAINKIKVSMNQQLHAFVCPNEIEPYFLAQFLFTMKNYMKAIATITTVPYMNKDNCESIVIVIPPINEQKKINSILSNVDDKIRDLKSKKTNLEKVKKGLMQKLLTGQIRV